MLRQQETPETSSEERGSVRFPPPLVYLAGLCLGAVLERIWPTPDLPTPVAVVVAAIAVFLFVALDFRSAALFAKKRTGIAPWHPSTVLVTEGPYRFTRNPMYLGMALLYLGMSLAFGLLWAAAALVPVIVVVDRAVIQREEPYLASKHGAAYEAYRKRVRRWI